MARPEGYFSKKLLLSHSNSVKWRRFQASGKIKARVPHYGFKGFSIDDYHLSSSRAHLSKCHVKKKEKKEKQLQEELLSIEGLTCSQCLLTFSSEYHLEKHTYFCGRLFLGPGEMGLLKENREMLLEPKSGMLVCPWCPRLCSSMPVLQRHVLKCKDARRKRYVKEVVRELPCPECPNVYLMLKSLLFHLKSHYVSDILCDPCQKSFSSSVSLSQHLLECKSNKAYKCSDCSYNFVSAAALRAHLLTCKSNTQCLKCAEVIFDRDLCIDHMMLHLTSEWSKRGLQLSHGVLYRVDKDKRLCSKEEMKPSLNPLPKRSIEGAFQKGVKPSKDSKTCPREAEPNQKPVHENRHEMNKAMSSRKEFGANIPKVTKDADSFSKPPLTSSLSCESSSVKCHNPSVENWTSNNAETFASANTSNISVNSDTSRCDDSPLSDEENFSVIANEVYEIENVVDDADYAEQILDKPEVSHTEQSLHGAGSGSILREPEKSDLGIDANLSDTMKLFTPAVNVNQCADGNELNLTVVNVEGGTNLFDWDDVDNDDNCKVNEFDEQSETCYFSGVFNGGSKELLSADSQSDVNEDEDSGIDATEDRDSNQDRNEDLNTGSQVFERDNEMLSNKDALRHVTMSEAAKHCKGNISADSAIPCEAAESDVVTSIPKVVLLCEPTLPETAAVAFAVSMPDDVIVSSEVVISDKNVDVGEVFLSSSFCDMEVVLDSSPGPQPKTKYSFLQEHSYAAPRNLSKQSKSKKQKSSPVDIQSKLDDSSSTSKKIQKKKTRKLKVPMDCTKDIINRILLAKAKDCPLKSDESVIQKLELEKMNCAESFEESTSAGGSSSMRLQKARLKKNYCVISKEETKSTSNVPEVSPTMTNTDTKSDKKDVCNEDPLIGILKTMTNEARLSHINGKVVPLRMPLTNLKTSYLLLESLPHSSFRVEDAPSVCLGSEKEILSEDLGRAPYIKHFERENEPSAKVDAELCQIEDTLPTVPKSDSESIPTERSPFSRSSSPSVNIILNQSNVKLVSVPSQDEVTASNIHISNIHPLLSKDNIVESGETAQEPLMNQKSFPYQSNSKCDVLMTSSMQSQLNSVIENPPKRCHISFLRKKEKSMLSYGFKQIATVLPWKKDYSKIMQISNANAMHSLVTSIDPTSTKNGKSFRPADVPKPVSTIEPVDGLFEASLRNIIGDLKNAWKKQLNIGCAKKDQCLLSPTDVSQPPLTSDILKNNVMEIIVKYAKVLKEPTSFASVHAFQLPPPAMLEREHIFKLVIKELFGDLLSILKMPSSVALIEINSAFKSSSILPWSDSHIYTKAPPSDRGTLKTAVLGIASKCENLLKESENGETNSSVVKESRSAAPLMFVVSSDGALLPHPNFNVMSIETVAGSKENLPPPRVTSHPPSISSEGFCNMDLKQSAQNDKSVALFQTNTQIGGNHEMLDNEVGALDVNRKVIEDSMHQDKLPDLIGPANKINGTVTKLTSIHEALIMPPKSIFADCKTNLLGNVVKEINEGSPERNVAGKEKKLKKGSKEDLLRALQSTVPNIGQYNVVLMSSDDDSDKDTTQSVDTHTDSCIPSNAEKCVKTISGEKCVTDTSEKENVSGACVSLDSNMPVSNNVSEAINVASQVNNALTENKIQVAEEMAGLGSNQLQPYKIIDMELCYDSSNSEDESKKQLDCRTKDQEDLLPDSVSAYTSSETVDRLNSENFLSGGFKEVESNFPKEKCSLFSDGVAKNSKLRKLAKKPCHSVNRSTPRTAKKKDNLLPYFRSKILNYRNLMPTMKCFRRKKLGREGLLRNTHLGTFRCGYCCVWFYSQKDLERHLCLKFVMKEKFASEYLYQRFYSAEGMKSLPNPSPKNKNGANKCLVKSPANKSEAKECLTNLSPANEKKTNNHLPDYDSPFINYLKMKTRVKKWHFPCNKCDLKFKNFSALHEHKSSVHNENSSLQCHICDKEFSRIQKLAVHVAKSHSKPTSGPSNGGTDLCATSDSLTEKCSSPHKISKMDAACIDNIKEPIKDNIEKPGKESTCIDNNNKSGKEATTIVNNIKKPRKEAICIDNFEKSTKKRSAKEKCSDPGTKRQGYLCQTCNKMFIGKNGLLSHVNQAHRQLFKCPVCLRRFTYLEKLKYHFKQFHAVSTTGEPTQLISVKSCDNVENPTLPLVKEEFESKEAPCEKDLESSAVERSFNCSVAESNGVREMATDIGSERDGNVMKRKKTKWRIVKGSPSEEGANLGKTFKSPRLSIKNESEPPQPLVLSLSKIKKSRYKCHNCDKNFKKQHHLLLHRLEVHKDCTQWSCPICNVNLSDFYLLQSHMKQCDGKIKHADEEGGSKVLCPVSAPSLQTILAVQSDPPIHSCDAVAIKSDQTRLDLRLGNMDLDEVSGPKLDSGNSLKDVESSTEVNSTAAVVLVEKVSEPKTDMENSSKGEEGTIEVIPEVAAEHVKNVSKPKTDMENSSKGEEGTIEVIPEVAAISVEKVSLPIESENSSKEVESCAEYTSSMVVETVTPGSNNKQENDTNNETTIAHEVFSDTIPKEQPPSTITSQLCSRSRSWKCEECKLEFRLKGYLERHNIKSHGALSKFDCTICNKFFVDRRSFRFHQNSKHKKKQSDCSLQTDDALTSSNSLKSIDVDESVKSVNITKGSSSSPVKAKKERKCGQCDKTFHRAIDLKRHRRRQHKARPLIKCHTCNLHFNRKDELTSHHSQVHAGDLKGNRSDSSRPCQTTKSPSEEQNSTNNKNADVPLNGGSEVDFSLSRCNDEKALSIPQELQERRETRSKLKPGEPQESKVLNCQDCPLSYKKFACLKRHRILMHGEPASHYCDICGKGFSYPHSLKNHMMSHSLNESKWKSQRPGNQTRKNLRRSVNSNNTKDITLDLESSPSASLKSTREESVLNKKDTSLPILPPPEECAKIQVSDCHGPIDKETEENHSPTPAALAGNRNLEDDSSNYSKPEDRGDEEKEQEDDSSNYSKPEDRGDEEKEQEDNSSNYSIPEDRGDEEKEQEDDSSNYSKPEDRGDEEKEQEDNSSNYSKPEDRGDEEKDHSCDPCVPFNNATHPDPVLPSQNPPWNNADVNSVSPPSIMAVNVSITNIFGSANQWGQPGLSMPSSRQLVPSYSLMPTPSMRPPLSFDEFKAYNACTLCGLCLPSANAVQEHYYMAHSSPNYYPATLPPHNTCVPYAAPMSYGVPAPYGVPVPYTTPALYTSPALYAAPVVYTAPVPQMAPVPFAPHLEDTASRYQDSIHSDWMQPPQVSDNVNATPNSRSDDGAASFQELTSRSFAHCSVCGLSFPSLFALQEHYATHMASSKNLSHHYGGFY